MGQVSDLPLRPAEQVGDLLYVAENFRFLVALLPVSFYRRRLPHWQPDQASIFLTWKLHGTFTRASTEDQAEGRRFAILDREWGRAKTGPMWLRDERIAACVVDTFFRGQGEWKLYDLFAWVILSNHVHLLIQPRCEIAEVTRAIKSYSAREANLILNRSGKPFWQVESYDHWVRDAREFEGIRRYIEWNPVNAGLVNRPEDWVWSSAWLGRSETCPTPV